MISSFSIWWLAIRPKTLWAAVAPVMLGTALAWGDRAFHWQSVVLALLGALSIQIGTNLVNDYFDFKTGADNPERIGPVRVMQAGLVKPFEMKIAIGLTFFLASIICFGLIQRAGWPVAVMGIFSILSAIFYTAGPYPLGYHGWGELFVFIFFGPVAVAGTYYVQSLTVHPAVILAGVGPGLLASAILVVNNIRDLSSDQNVGKKTLAVRFGKSFAFTEYLFLVMGASLIPIAVDSAARGHSFSLIACLTGLLAIPTIKTVLTRTDGPSLNQALADTARLLLIYSFLFSLGWLI